ncbi:MAG: right-handed parallel beta-helix repeat-containing protein [Alphaproteobacteria bacterium]|nr:right-handed parallel beta-helix repeat-containing protein [Alphaproteobacteria bacterium]
MGPTRALKMPSDAARVARDRDIVEIDAGVYVDCAVWRANRLTIRGNGGLATVKTKTCQGKAIWVIDGDDTTVERIAFADAAVPDKNGAGIRLTGGSLVVRDSVFEGNENGILAGDAPGKSVLIERSRFERNGKCDPVCAHGIYINQVRELTVRDCVFRDQRVGHHIKSRALNTTVTGTIIEDGRAGTASYLIDVPNGGNVLIARNKLQKANSSDNRTIAIAIGMEGAKHPSTAVRIENNDFRSDVTEPTSFVRNNAPYEAVLSGNALCGSVVALTGPGTVRSPRPCTRP